MAGKRQHILPRFLLNGFASQTNNQTVLTWLFRKNAPLREVSTKDVSVGEYFYGKEGEVTVDDEITRLEQEFAPLLDELREKDDQTPVSNLNVVEFVTHLCIRTKHLRDSLRESSEFLIESISEYLLDPETLKAFISNNPQLLKHEIEKVVKQYPLIEPFKDEILNQGASMLLALLDQFKPGIQPFIQEFIEQGRGMLPRAVKEGHIKALAKGLVPEPRAEAYRLLEWFVCKSEIPLILGDMGCSFEIIGSRRFKSINEKSDQIKNIFLPISSDRILIGTSLPVAPKIDTNEINQATAKCSRDFFVCSEASSSKTNLILVIGKESAIVSKAEVEQLIRDVAEEIGRQATPNNDT